MGFTTVKAGGSTRILAVSASGRINGSVSRMLSDDLINALEIRHGSVAVTRRELRDGTSFVDEAWINANSTHPEKRSAQQRKVLAESDHLVEELQNADIIVIGVPMYNFSIPAALKAWVDMIARAGLTFRYTKNGAEGRLHDKKVYLVVATGGAPVDSPVDFATPYLRHVLGFLGMTDVAVIAADRLNDHSDESIDAARFRIAELVHVNTHTRAA